MLAVIAAWFTRHGFGQTHDLIGYLALVVVLGRLAWGMLGSPYARFRQFVRAPRSTGSYAFSVLKRRQRRYLGHNPLGGWMSLLLWTLVLLVCLTGWLYTTDRYWGVEWVETLHRVLTNGLLACVAIHLAGVIVTSLHDKENLILSMINGRKRPAGKGEIP
jgi:cytochrome b